MQYRTLKYLFFIPAFLCCNHILLGQTQEDSCTGPIVRDTSYTIAVNASSPPLRFHLEQGERCYRLTMFKTGQQKPMQIIEHETESDEPLPTVDRDFYDRVINFIDVNFDHSKDLMILDNISIHNSYIYYLFDPASGIFKFSEEFSNFIGNEPVIDTVGECISTTGGTSDKDWCSDTYEVDNGKLVLAEREEVSIYSLNGEVQTNSKGEELCIHTLKRLVHGKLVTVKKVIATEADLDHEWNKQ